MLFDTEKMGDERDRPGMTRITRVRPPAPLMTGAKSHVDWVRWKEDWDDYPVVQDIARRPDNYQCSLFHIALGTEGKKMLCNHPVPKHLNGRAHESRET